MMFDTQLDFDTTDAAQKRRNEEITTALRDFLATMPGTIVLRTRTGRELHLSQR
jgi:DNA recombination-dependent growth factor C